MCVHGDATGTRRKLTDEYNREVVRVKVGLDFLRWVLGDFVKDST